MEQLEELRSIQGLGDHGVLGMGATLTDLRPVELLILQTTAFCNIDCAYCYLPDRSNKKIMHKDTVHAAVDSVFDFPIQNQPFTIVFHAGEPLMSGIDVFRAAIERASIRASTDVWASFNVQTNGMLIDQSWCDLFKAHKFKVGVSIDGPEFLHNRYRKNRAGKGTFLDVMRGIDCLRRNDIPFHVLSVLTVDSYAYSAEMYSFYKGLGATSVCFNVDEVEGVNEASTTFLSDELQFKRFWIDFTKLWLSDKMEMDVRELRGLTNLVRSFNEHEVPVGNQMSFPFSILTVAVNGDVSTFSPELSGTNLNSIRDFKYGNILRETLAEIAASLKLQSDFQELLAGVKNCLRNCEYFSICGGGSPSNKYYENGNLSSTETNNCRFTKKYLSEAVLETLEEALLQ